MKPELKERQEKLEDILRKEAHISVGDRLKNLGYNIKENVDVFVPFGIALALGGLVTWDIYTLVNHAELTSNYKAAYDFVNSLHGTLKSAVEHGTQLHVSHEMIELPRQLIEKGSQQIYAKKAQELLNGISQHSKLFSQGSITKPMIEYLGTLKDGLSGLAARGKEMWLTLGALDGGLIDAAVLLLAGKFGFDNVYWSSQIDDKRILKRDLKDSLPNLRERFDSNTNASEAYDFLDVIVETGIGGSDLLETANIVSGFSDAKYRPVFEAITLHPKKYLDGRDLKSAFKEFDKQLEKETSSNEATQSAQESGECSAKLFKPVKYSDLYLTLLGGGWLGRKISLNIEKVEKTGAAREFFSEALSESAHKETLFSNVMTFYEAFGKLVEDKRLTIAKYLFQKGSRQFSGRLTSCEVEDEAIMQYVSGLDEVPSVGVKGQIKTLMRLNNVAKHLSTLGQADKVAGLRKLISYKQPQFDESAVEVGQFLSRHPNIPADEVFGALAEYYQLTGGDQFTSNWIKKETSRVGTVKQESLEGLLDKKGERKFVEEVKRKVSLARFEAFNRAIDDLYFAPLDDMLGEKVDRTGLEITDELINVILGYNRTDFKGELQPKVRALVKTHLENPEGTTVYLAGLEGNRKLEERLGQTLVNWRTGHTSSHDVGIDRTVKQKIQDQVKREYADFTRCVVELGYKLPQVEGVTQKPKTTEEAERVFKEASKLNVPEEKRYLVVEAKHHLTNLKQKSGIVKRGYGTIKFYDSQDPIEAMQMGVVSGSCTNVVRGINLYAAFVNALDDNKKVVYMADKEGAKIGRTLAVLTDGGIVTYRKYENTNLSTDEAWVDHFQDYAHQVGVPLIVPTRFATDGLEKVLKSRGATKKTVSTVMQKAVCDKWYDDAGGGRVSIGDEGYKMELDAYVLA